MTAARWCLIAVIAALWIRLEVMTVRVIRKELKRNRPRTFWGKFWCVMENLQANDSDRGFVLLLIFVALGIGWLAGLWDLWN